MKFLATLALALLGAQTAFAGDGELDPTFAGNGKAVFGFTQNMAEANAAAQGVAVQSDGKLIVVGYANGYSVAMRLNTDGSVDGTFGIGGFVIGPIAHGSDQDVDLAISAAIQPDGKVLIFGTNEQDAYIIRLNANGSPDATFGNAGVVLYPGTGSASRVALFQSGVVTSSGNIIVTGSYADGSGNPGTIIDVLFDATGHVVFAHDFSALIAQGSGTALLQPDGKFIAVNGVGGHCIALRENVSSTLSLDTTFGTNGIALVDWNIGGDNFDTCEGAALQRDGKLIVAGYGDFASSAGSSRAIVARLLPDGTLDTAFGRKNYALADANPGIPNFFNSVLVQNDGRIVLTGGAGVEDPAHAPMDFAAVRLLPDGSLDTTFTASTPGSSLGKVVFGFEVSSTGRYDQSYAAALEGNEVVLVGSRRTSTTNRDQFAIARLQNDRIFMDGYEP